MAQLLVRELETSTVNALKKLAKAHDRSLQAEVKRILEKVAKESIFDPEKAAAKIRKKLADNQHTDSAKLLREDRGR